VFRLLYVLGAPDAFDGAPDAFDVAPDAFGVAPDAFDVAPGAFDVAPDTFDVAPIAAATHTALAANSCCRPSYRCRSLWSSPPPRLSHDCPILFGRQPSCSAPPSTPTLRFAVLCAFSCRGISEALIQFIEAIISPGYSIL
jgi:hypothetical protein